MVSLINLSDLQRFIKSGFEEWCYEKIANYNNLDDDYANLLFNIATDTFTISPTYFSNYIIFIRKILFYNHNILLKYTTRFSFIYYILIHIGVFDIDYDGPFECINRLVLLWSEHRNEDINVINDQYQLRSASGAFFSLPKEIRDSDEYIDIVNILIFLPLVEPFMEFLHIVRPYCSYSLMYSICNSAIAEKNMQMLDDTQRVLTCCLLDDSILFSHLQINNFLNNMNVNMNLINYTKCSNFLLLVNDNNLELLLFYALYNSNFVILDKIKWQMDKFLESISNDTCYFYNTDDILGFAKAIKLSSSIIKLRDHNLYEKFSYNFLCNVMSEHNVFFYHIMLVSSYFKCNIDDSDENDIIYSFQIYNNDIDSIPFLVMLSFVVVLQKFKKVSLRKCFCNCYNLKSIDFPYNFDTSNVVDMSYMFSGCSTLKNIDLSVFDTSNVTSMIGMFSDCSNLKSLDLSSFDTSHVSNMYSMFSSCYNLESIVLTSFNTSSVTDMGSIFVDCYKLEYVDLTTFDTSNVTNFSYMFKGCYRLDSICLNNFDTSKASSMESMFTDCLNLEELDLSTFKTPNVTSMCNMFCGCKNLKTINIATLNTVSVISFNGMFSNCLKLKELNVQSFNTINSINMSKMFNRCESITELNLRSFETSNVENMSFMFNGCTNLRHIELGSFNTSNVTNMNSMFSECFCLEDPFLLSFNTSKVFDTRSMFSYCTNIKTLNIRSFNFSSVRDTNSMFKGISNKSTILFRRDDVNGIRHIKGELPTGVSLEITDKKPLDMLIVRIIKDKMTLRESFREDKSFVHVYWRDKNVEKVESNDLVHLSDLHIYNGGISLRGLFSMCKDLNSVSFLSDKRLSKIFDMSSMFSKCSNLVSVNMISLDTEFVIDMSSMFSHCKTLSHIDLSTFNTSNVINMSSMFSFCSQLVTINLSSFDTSNVINLSYMFNGCSKLEHLDLSSFNTSSAENMSYMFAGCFSIKNLDLSTFTSENVVSASCMFAGCNNLEKINLNSFALPSHLDLSYMFLRCYNLSSVDIKSIYISNTTDITGIFKECPKFSTLDPVLLAGHKTISSSLDNRQS